jgi:S-DNA-T family DNA segregation ATPase FtsK/SpoIIIE
MKLLGPTPYRRLNEAGAVVFAFAAIFFTLSLVSYHPEDPSWNTATAHALRPRNLIGFPGAWAADFVYQTFGIAGFAIPPLMFVWAWKWFRSAQIQDQLVKTVGALLLVCAVCTVASFPDSWSLFGGVVRAGGVVGLVLADWLIESLNFTGAMLATALALILALYLISRFEMALLARWLRGPIGFCRAAARRWGLWREHRRQVKAERERERAARIRAKRAAARQARELADAATAPANPPIVEPGLAVVSPEGEAPPVEEDIPIRTLEDELAAQARPPDPLSPGAKPAKGARTAGVQQRVPAFELPPTELLNEPQGRNVYDSLELKDIAARIKSKFEEFNVLGAVVQINPGPVVTTFEFKPEAGIKYSRITTLTEDLCLGLHAESILIERIPGKPTVGIEVPNTRREVISLREILESDEFQNSASRLTFPLGKDINGRIRVAALESMPHLLIAGSTGSGKSVMLNSMIMSILYKSTPEEVRMIMVDPKRVELGIYEGIPHLMTPVITDPKKATNALRNAVLEMERRLKLLASQGVRNIDQFNRKVRQLQLEPRNLFAEDDAGEEDLSPLPYILILIDELADLMMVERGNVEEAVTRLAQMARAVGMHLVLATQRPSVDVITGLIKANFPARISFRVATRVDSRTILDVMGAEHLLGKGDMLFLPPGSSRLVRVHGAFVTEIEAARVVDFWKAQARPEYDQSFLIAPPSDDETEDGEAFEGERDPLYEDAVRVVCDVGKASTSTLQRRLRLGYGRAARILDMMQRDGIIGPPDGSRPRDVLKRPDWLDAVEQVR